MSTIRIITTEDGSHSVLNEQLNETYHSVHGALQESMHVFIKHGLDYTAKHLGKQVIHILEIGFGTGLNALLTLQQAEEKEYSIHYTTIEAFPLEVDVWKELNYATTGTVQQQFSKLHQSQWNEWINISQNFRLLKLHTTLQKAELQQNYFDLIYFDAFAPGKQPELWELPVLKKIADAMKKDGVFVTYCAKGQVKRDLKNSGLHVETLQGPPGKREMVRAVKI